MSAIGTLEEAAAPARLESRGGAREVAASVEAGHVFTYAEVAEEAARGALLAEVLERVASPSRKVIRVGNQLRAPLTIERIMIQAAGPDADSGVAHDPALLASLLAKQAEADGRVLIVIEQPETIDPEAVALLQSMRAHLLGGCVQVLLAGPASSARVLSDAERPEVPVREEAPAAVPLEGPKRVSMLPEPVAAPPRKRRALRMVVAVVMLFGAAGVLLGTVSRSSLRSSPMTGPAAGEVPARARAGRSSSPEPGPVPPVLVQEAFESGRVTVRLPGSQPAAPLAGLRGSN